MTAHRYWRLYAPADAGAGATAIAELELHASSSSANLSVTGNGTASASSTGAGSPADAFDGTSSSWVSGGGSPQWLKWDFGAGNEQDIRYVTITCTNASYCPVGGVIQYSDDNATWVSFISLASLPAAIATTSFSPPTGSLLVTAQAATVLAYGGASAQISAQAGIVSGYSGAQAPILTQAPVVSATVGTKVAIVAQLPLLTFNGHDAAGERSFTGVTPLPLVSGTFGGGAALSAQAPAVASAGTVVQLGEFDLDVPGPTVSASGTTSALGQFNLTMTTAKLVGYSGAVCAVTDGGVTLAVSATTGGVATATVTLPLFTIAARGTVNDLSSANLIMPSPVLGAGGNVAWLVVPGATLVAVGSATVTITYEGYAVNLKHTAPPRPGFVQVDEMTHYTNYPFDRIVRYQNSYYGVAADGLYLLEGTTDYDPVTPPEVHYSVQTAITDFGSTMKKTVVAMYVGGRLGPSSTISITAGEDTPTTYYYQTPRDAAAQNYRQVFGKGIKERYVAFGMDGSGPMTVDTLDFDLATLTRRI